MIVSYISQLNHAARNKGISLLQACKNAGVSTATYYRWANGRFEPRYETARQIAEQLDEMPDVHPTRDHG